MATESSPLVSKKENSFGSWYNPKIFPFPLSVGFRLCHNLNYALGGACFLFGSMCYFNNASNYELGGWLFTIGSAGFLIADLSEWWTNNRVGCFDTKQLREQCTENQSESDDQGMFDFCGIATNGVNFFMSACGSTLYLIGSIYFIPELDLMMEGTWLFIYGSCVIALSQFWKLARYPSWATDIPAVHVDLAAGVGGIFYLIGSIQFLPQNLVSLADTDRAAWLFTAGGFCFTWSGLAMAYRYFYAKPSMFPKELGKQDSIGFPC
jgi:hypothetical protein